MEQSAFFSHICHKSPGNKGDYVGHRDTHLLRGRHPHIPPWMPFLPVLIISTMQASKSDLHFPEPGAPWASTVKFPADFVLAGIARLHVGEFSSNSTKRIACVCAVKGRSGERGDIMVIPGTSGLPRKAAASSLHTSQNLDWRQKQLFLLINSCSGAQKYPKHSGSEMVPFPWRSIWFPKSNHKLLNSVSWTSQLIIFLQSSPVRRRAACEVSPDEVLHHK